MSNVILEFSGTLVAKAGLPDRIPVEADTVHAAISRLQTLHPKSAGLLTDSDGNLRKFVNIFVDDVDMRMLEGIKTPLRGTERVSFYLAVAGG